MADGVRKTNDMTGDLNEVALELGRAADHLKQEIDWIKESREETGRLPEAGVLIGQAGIYSPA